MARGKSSIVASSKAVDPTLAALFDSSAGPLKPSKKSQPTQPQQRDEDEDDTDQVSSDAGADEHEDQDSSDDDGEEEEDAEQQLSDQESATSSENGGVRLEQDSDGDEYSDGDESLVSASPAQKPPIRKRKRGGDGDDLEARYFEKLARTEDPNPAEKKRKGDDGQPSPTDHKDSGSSDEDDNQSDDDGFIPVHEAVSEASAPIDLTKDEAARTVYLANISTEAVVSKSGKTTLTTHLRSVLDPEATPAQRLEKLRFRSLPFSSAKIPKRAAFITKSLLDSTTKAAQGYAVYSTQAAARTAAKKLNGTIVLQRHLRADLNAHPDEKDHRRCVFVGNLNFVDDEIIMDSNSDGDSVARKKSKVPADAEEGLWRTFVSKAGPVEFVRLPRDPVSRVGKGFAYVQFKDGTSVEKALLLNNRKFPPMLPRPIRVSRCKDPRKTARAVEKTKGKMAKSSQGGSHETRYRPKITAGQKSDMGRASKLLGRGGAAMIRRGAKPSGKAGGDGDAGGGAILDDGNVKTPQQVVLEGRRASEKDGRPAGMKFGKVRGKGKGKKPVPKGGRPQNRGTRRAAEWRKSSEGGK